MDWSEAVHKQVSALKPIGATTDVAQRVIHLQDFTSLNEGADEASMAAFFEKADTPLGKVAAVCVLPEFVGLAAVQFAGSATRVASVANFPHGDDKLETVLVDIGRAVAAGAQEIDVVFPYQRYLAGDRKYTHTFVETCKDVCGDDVLLKVILETGALGDLTIIADASFDVLTAGADFIKTSTGKISEGATPEAAATMLLVIHHLADKVSRPLGFKASGGIRTLEAAAQYVALADNIMGREWVVPAHFRIGASQLFS